MVTIKIKGTGRVFGLMEVDDANYDFWYETPIVLSGIEVYADDEDITKKKGKYIKQKFFTDQLKKSCGELIDLYVAFNKYNDLEFECYYDLDVDDFDPKKLQLIKSDYEFEVLPYGILIAKIVYDGNILTYDTISAYDEDNDEEYDEDAIDDLQLPYGTAYEYSESVGYYCKKV